MRDLLFSLFPVREIDHFPGLGEIRKFLMGSSKFLILRK
jgi:hypothetical protein